MKSSLKIARIAGIGVYLHVTFPLLLVWIAIVHFQQQSAWRAFFDDIVLICALFAVVVLHELGHALAVRLGNSTHDTNRRAQANP